MGRDLVSEARAARSAISASTSRTAARRVTRQATNVRIDTARYEAAARRGQVTVYTREAIGAAAILAKQQIQAAEAKHARELRDDEAMAAAQAAYTATKTAVKKTPETPPAVVNCPRGLRYTKRTRWSACDAGYVSTKGSGLTILGQSIYPYMPGNECVCVDTPAGEAITKSESEPKPTDLPTGTNGEGEGFFGGFLGEGEGGGKITGIATLLVVGAIIVSLLGMFKK